jgi:RNA polymerase sigma-70 factor (ECF subfamily)
MVTELDQELPGIIARAQAGDSGAFTEIYRRYAGVILRFLYARTQEQEGAQDLTQEVFMRVLKGINGFEYRGEKSFLGWLYTIAGNVLVGHVRRKQPISTPLDEGLKLVDPHGQQAVSSLYDRLELQEAMSRLTEDQQRVVTMKFFADMTNSEIATIIGRSEGAVKALQNRAITALSQIMKQEHAEPLHARELNGRNEHWEPLGVAGAQLDGATSVASPIGAQARLAGNGTEREKRARES